MTTKAIRRQKRKYQVLVALCLALLSVDAGGLWAAYWQHDANRRRGDDVALDIAIRELNGGCDKSGAVP